jgi:hypothetical protein
MKMHVEQPWSSLIVSLIEQGEMYILLVVGCGVRMKSVVLRRFLVISWMTELHLCCGLPLQLFCDNQATVNMVNNPIHHDRTKHVEIDISSRRICMIGCYGLTLLKL